jgi:glycosyltransferase involved in cell wall biosynthesis
MPPLISMVMAVYNGSRFLEAQVHSILKQSYKNFELVVVDDVSSDDSFDILTRLARSEPRIKLHKNVANVGIVGNFLNALRYSCGELVCFADQDDIWREDKLEILSALILKSPENMLAYSDLEICDSNLKTIHPSFWKVSGIRPRSGVLGEFAFFRNIAPGCSMMFRNEIRDVLLQTLPKSSFIHDHLAFVLASLRGRVVYSRQRLVKYRQHAMNNIGAFYPSVTDFERFSEQLRREIMLLKPALTTDLSDLERFLSVRGREKIFPRLTFLRFYLWLRIDSFFSKCLGLFECLTPSFYQQCRRGFHAYRAV